MKKLGAVIIEDRKIADFYKIVKEHMKYLPKDTDIIIYTSESTEKEYRKLLKEDNIQFRLYPSNISIPNSIKNVAGFDELLKNNPHLKPILNYCLFLTSRDFWIGLYEYERALTFQVDSGLLREGIEEFLDWDYIGAPCYNYVGDKTIQNGGLSIRNPRIMEYICRNFGWNTDLQELIQLGQYSTASFFAEDIFFCLRMIKYNIGNYAPIDICKKFSVESKFELGTLGYHRPTPYMDESAIRQILTQYNKK
jgi:hypothetical protein